MDMIMDEAKTLTDLGFTKNKVYFGVVEFYDPFFDVENKRGRGRIRAFVPESYPNVKLVEVFEPGVSHGSTLIGNKQSLDEGYMVRFKVVTSPFGPCAVDVHSLVRLSSEDQFLPMVKVLSQEGQPIATAVDPAFHAHSAPFHHRMVFTPHDNTGNAPKSEWIRSHAMEEIEESLPEIVRPSMENADNEQEKKTQE